MRHHWSRRIELGWREMTSEIQTCSLLIQFPCTSHTGLKHAGHEAQLCWSISCPTQSLSCFLRVLRCCQMQASFQAVSGIFTCSAIKPWKAAI